MNVSLYQAASALGTQARWQEVIANNLAASAVPGFKKQDLSVRATPAGVLPTAANGTRAVGLPTAEVATNFRPGELQYTGGQTDVALQGPGFLAVQLPDGNIAYTRDGELRLDPSGQLVTKQGYPVLGENGPILLDPKNAQPISISPEGEVSQGPQLRGRLRVVEFNNPSWLTAIGRGYYLAQHADLSDHPARETVVRQGYLESANTSPAEEMANMITALRLYEANQRVIRAHDERMSRAINELGNT